jgi:hypothetical protein
MSIDRIAAGRHHRFMRIESIDFNRSSETELALITSPPFDRNVYQEFQKLLSNSAPLSTVQFREEASRLCISTASLSLTLRETIESFLTSAEQAAAEVQKAVAEQERLTIQKKERAIAEAARAMGIKVKRAESDYPGLPGNSH